MREQNQFHGFSTAKASCQQASERALVRILFEMDSEHKGRKRFIFTYRYLSAFAARTINLLS